MQALIEIAESTELSITETSCMIITMNRMLMAQDLTNPQVQEIVAGVAYWFSKLGRLIETPTREMAAKLFEESSFTDPNIERWQKCRYNVVNAAMKLLINTSRNVAWDDFRKQMKTDASELLHMRMIPDKFDVYRSLMDDVCRKHGFTDSAAYLQSLRV